MVAIKLLYWPGACSLAGHILLNEVGVDFTAVRYDGSDQMKEQLQKLNPKMKVPVMEIDDQVITENVAILTAISQLAPDQNLLGKTDLEKLRVYEYLAYLAGTLHGQAYGTILRPNRFSDLESAHKSIQEKGMQMTMECYEYINARLDGVYAVGGQLTVVDPYLYVFWRWGVDRIADMEERFPKYADLVNELAKLESVKRTLEQEQIDGKFPSKL